MMNTVKNLVIAVSPDSSLELLEPFADIIVLDRDTITNSDIYYETIYIRSHFSQPSTLPQAFRNKIDTTVEHTRNINPRVKFVDNMSDVDAIVAFEDKWLQYKTFGQFMPRTELYSDQVDISSFTQPVYKERLSSRGSGTTWDQDKVLGVENEWIIQDSLDITEELRIYIICGEVYPVGAIKQNMTEGQKAQSSDFRKLTQNETNFSLNVMYKATGLDFVGIDIARTSDGELKLMEVNRSPGFAKFCELTGHNLADELYEKLARG